MTATGHLAHPVGRRTDSKGEAVTKTLAILAAGAALLAFAIPAMGEDNGSVTPQTITGTASVLSNHSAVLKGNVSSSGLSLDLYFEYGPTTAYGSKTTPASLLFSGTASVSTTVNGLDTNTLYHYRFVAQGVFGTSYGEDMTLTTNDSGSGDSGKSSGGSNGTSTTVTTDSGAVLSTVPVTSDSSKGSGSGSSGGGDDNDTSDDSGSATLVATQLGDDKQGPAGQPELGRKVVAGVTAGSVGVRSPGSSRYATLAGNAPV